MRRFKTVAREMDEFQKEALRLFKELADDEKELKRAQELAREYESESNIAKAEDEVDCAERRIDRKLRLIDTVFRC